LNANHPIVCRMIQDSLRYWVTHMHVDGFRFDLASILSRGEDGRPLANPPVRWDIESDPVLAGTKLIAEAWDAAGLYQVGSFVGDAWHEWNGRFRDDVRRFLKGDSNSVSALAARILGSPDMYGHEERVAEQSIEQSHSLAFTLQTQHSRYLLHVMLNAYWEPLTFELPPVPASESGQEWRRCMDTALPSPDDACFWEHAALVAQSSYVVQPRSIVLLARRLQTAAKNVSAVR
jgi:pullulanase/glycogen debranching enzyme